MSRATEETAVQAITYCIVCLLSHHRANPSIVVKDGQTLCASHLFYIDESPELSLAVSRAKNEPPVTAAVLTREKRNA